MPDKYVIAKYLRLSLEDGDCPESDSISNQRTLLDFRINADFDNTDIEVVELIDDGFTGTNMNRPALKRLLVLAETHGISCIIVKDFSRFARDYIEVGRYTDIIFPQWRVRFISVNDSYDSKDYVGITCGIDVAIKNLANTIYSRDLSEKIKSVKRIQHKQGQYLSTYAIYGYMKNPERKKQLIIDIEAATIVRRIFLMRKKGMTYKAIANTLNDEGIPSPSEYKKLKGTASRRWSKTSEIVYWNPSIVRQILYDERYTGKMVSGKTENAIVGSGKLIRKSKEEQFIVENTHEAIIEQDLFDEVQPEKKERTKSQHKITLLSGLIRCGECNHMLAQYNNSEPRRFHCRYKGFVKNLNCFDGTILESEIVEIVKNAVYNELSKASDVAKLQRKLDENIKTHEHKINLVKKKIKGLKQQKMDAYIRFAKGLLQEADFQSVSKNIGNQIAECEKELTDCTNQRLCEEDMSVLNLFGRYIGTDELTNDMLKDIIKAIYVYGDKRITIQWNFKEI